MPNNMAQFMRWSKWSTAWKTTTDQCSFQMGKKWTSVSCPNAKKKVSSKARKTGPEQYWNRRIAEKRRMCDTHSHSDKYRICILGKLWFDLFYSLTYVLNIVSFTFFSHISFETTTFSFAGIQLIFLIVLESNRKREDATPTKKIQNKLQE